MVVRLNKFLAERVGLSRREADDAIAAGKVTVNDKVAELGARLDKTDKVCYNGKIVASQTAYAYVMFNKPVGYVCSRKKQGSAETIYAALPEEFQHLKTVGRLDKDSSGLILLTNDGTFAYEMTHPKFIKIKKYIVELDRALAREDQREISKFGVELEDGYSKLGLKRGNDARTKWEVTMYEGRNRQIRRTFAAVGYEVVSLHRIRFGGYELKGLHEGEWEYVRKYTEGIGE